MVSLTNPTRGSEGFFFTNEENSLGPGGILYDSDVAGSPSAHNRGTGYNERLPLLNTQSRFDRMFADTVHRSRYINATRPVLVLLFSLTLNLAFLFFPLPTFTFGGVEWTHGSVCLLVREVVMYLVVVLVHTRLQSIHSRSREYGCEEFYYRTKLIRTVPLFMVTLDNTILLVLLALVNSSIDLENNLFTYMRAITFFEAVICVSCMVSYLAMVRKFNNTLIREERDVNSTTFAATSPLVSTPASND
eukprot:CFRG4618T1